MDTALQISLPTTGGRSRFVPVPTPFFACCCAPRCHWCEPVYPHAHQLAEAPQSLDPEGAAADTLIESPLISAPTPPLCTVNVEIDAYSGDSDSASPFWVLVTGLRNGQGESLGPPDDTAQWGQNGAGNPYQVPEIMSDTLTVMPISETPGTYWKTPYIQLNLGSHSWRSDGPYDAEGYGCKPPSYMNWDGDQNNIPNP
jgi:hypothetical protein